jgi:hypothetical protein
MNNKRLVENSIACGSEKQDTMLPLTFKIIVLTSKILLCLLEWVTIFLENMLE